MWAVQATGRPLGRPHAHEVRHSSMGINLDV
jgi:hypothetical protein